jgi:hypothetical protein
MTKLLRGVISSRTMQELAEQGISFFEAERLARVAGADSLIVSDEDFTNGIVVCGPAPGTYADNVITTCGKCGAAICHRPFVPAHLPKLCIYCAHQAMESENE